MAEDNKGESKAAEIAESQANLPLDQRVTHEHWKVREIAYDQLAKAFESSEENATIYTDYCRSLIKMAKDPNQAAQLAGLNAIFYFIEYGPLPMVHSQSKSLAKAIAEKGLNVRPINRTKSSELILALVGAECGLEVVEIFASCGFKIRAKKAISATANTLCDALHAYGKKHVPVREVSKHVPKLLSDSSKEVREAGKKLAVLLNRWTREPAETLLSGVRGAFIRELEPLFAENSKKSKPKPTKKTRSKLKRDRRIKTEIEEEDSDSQSEEEEVDAIKEDTREGVDLWERLQPLKVVVEVDKKLNPIKYDPWEKAFRSTDYKHYRRALDDALSEIGTHKIKPGSHEKLVPRIANLLRKTKLPVVVSSCAKFVTLLVNSLRKDLGSPVCHDFAESLVMRLKETNKAASTSVVEALDSLHTMKLVKIVELRSEIEASCTVKSPKARATALNFIGRIIEKGTPTADVKGDALLFFGKLFFAQTGDRSTEVRNAALYAISVLQVVAGKKAMAKFVDKLDKQRKLKVESVADQLREARKARKAISNEKKEPKNLMKPKSVEKHKSTKESKKEENDKPSSAPIIYISDDEVESPIDSDSSLEAAAARYPEFNSENWSHKLAKTRAACVKSLSAAVADKEVLEDDDVNILLSLLSRDKGLAESNFMLLGEKLNLMGTIAEKCRNPMPRKTLSKLLTPTIDKLGDIKSAKLAEKALLILTESTSPRFMFKCLGIVAKETKNGRAKIAILKFCTKIVDDFGIPAVKPEDIAELIAYMLSQEAIAALVKPIMSLSCNSSIRTPGSFRDMLVASKVSEDHMDRFDSELEKYKNAPDAPTKQKRQFFQSHILENVADQESIHESEKLDKNDVLSERESEDSDDSDESEEVIEAPPLPPPESPKELVRVSIAKHFAPGAGIMNTLKSKDWATRRDCLKQIDNIVLEAHSFILAKVGRSIFPLLQERMTESNINVAAAAYETTGNLVEAMGPDGVMHINVVMPTILGKGCTNGKKNVQNSAMKCLEGWFKTVGFSNIIPYLHLPFKVKPDKKGKIRKEMLDWILPRVTEVVTNMPKGDELTPLIIPCLTCLQDNISEVRKLAEMLLAILIKNMGYETVKEKLPAKKSIKFTLTPIIEKYANLNESKEASAPKTAVRKAPQRKGTALPQKSKISKTSVVRSPIKKSVGVRGRAPSSTSTTTVDTHKSSSEEHVPDTISKGSDPKQRKQTKLKSKNSNPSTIQEKPEVKENMLKNVSKPKYSTVSTMRNKEQKLGNQHLRPKIEKIRRTPLVRPPEEQDVLIANEKKPERQEILLHRKRRLTMMFSVSEGKEQLAEDLITCVSPSLYSKLTAPTNRFKSHLEAMKSIQKLVGKDPESAVTVSDVLIRWALCRLQDRRTPSSVIIHMGEYITCLCELLLSSGEKLTEYESCGLVPAVVKKCGSSRRDVEASMETCLLSIEEVVSDDTMLNLLFRCLRQPISERAGDHVSRNICELIDRKCESGAGLPIDFLPGMAKIAYDKREAPGRVASECIARAHFHFGDELWELLGPLTDNQAEIIESRLEFTNSSQHIETPAKTPGPRTGRNGNQSLRGLTQEDIFYNDFRFDGMQTSNAGSLRKKGHPGIPFLGSLPSENVTESNLRAQNTVRAARQLIAERSQGFAESSVFGEEYLREIIFGATKTPKTLRAAKKLISETPQSSSTTREGFLVMNEQQSVESIGNRADILRSAYRNHPLGEINGRNFRLSIGEIPPSLLETMNKIINSPPPQVTSIDLEGGSLLPSLRINAPNQSTLVK